jgi:hypothetical protein
MFVSIITRYAAGFIRLLAGSAESQGPGHPGTHPGRQSVVRETGGGDYNVSPGVGAGALCCGDLRETAEP